MNVRSRRNSTCPWRLKVLWSHGWFTPYHGAPALPYPVQRGIFAPLRHTFDEYLRQTGPFWKFWGVKGVVFLEIASGKRRCFNCGGGHVVSLKLWVGWELGEVCCMYVDTVVYA